MVKVEGKVVDRHVEGDWIETISDIHTRCNKLKGPGKKKREFGYLALYEIKWGKTKTGRATPKYVRKWKKLAVKKAGGKWVPATKKVKDTYKYRKCR